MILAALFMPSIRFSSFRFIIPLAWLVISRKMSGIARIPGTPYLLLHGSKYYVPGIDRLTAAFVLALWITIFTVYRTVLSGLKRDLALFLAFRACSLMHLLWPWAKSATTLIPHAASFLDPAFFHVLLNNRNIFIRGLPRNITGLRVFLGQLDLPPFLFLLLFCQFFLLLYIRVIFSCQNILLCDFFTLLPLQLTGLPMLILIRVTHIIDWSGKMPSPATNQVI